MVDIVILQAVTATEARRTRASGSTSRSRHFDDMAALQTAVLAELPHLGSLLVKGARFMAMERLLAAIDASLQTQEAAPHAA